MASGNTGTSGVGITKDKETVEPKKSARLAEKRKLREEAGAWTDDDYYFTPLTKTSRYSNRQSSTSPLPVSKDLPASTSASVDTATLESKVTKGFKALSVSRSTAGPLCSKLQNLSVDPPCSSNTEKNSTEPSLKVVSPTKPAQQTQTAVDKEPAACSADGNLPVSMDQDEPSTLTSLPPKEAVQVEPTQVENKKGVLYINRSDSITLSFPLGMEYPLPMVSIPPRVPPVIFCGIPGCPNRKKYRCSKTGVPLCSLECYNKNLSIKNVDPKK